MKDSVQWSEIVRSGSSGDLILFKTKGKWYDKLISWFSGSPYTHIGMIVRGIRIRGCDSGLALLESGSEPFCDCIMKRNICGVRLSTLEKVVETYRDGTCEGEIYYRKLNCNRGETFAKTLESTINAIYGEPYDVLPQDWLRAALGIDVGPDQRRNTFWCSALVAYAYDMLGFVPSSTPWTLAEPGQFSSSSRNPIPLDGRVELEPDVLVSYD